MTATASMPFPREPANYDEVSMQQSMLFSDSLKDLKNLRKQLYSAAEYFELSYTNDDQKHIVVSTLKDYAIKALVNTVDHLGSVTYKVNDLLDEKVDEVSGTELRVSCIEQRLRTCQEYIDREGISQQSLVINTPNYHKRYILPVGETMHGAVRTKSKYQGCSLDDGDEWHQFKNASYYAAIRATIRETPPPSILGALSITVTKTCPATRELFILWQHFEERFRKENSVTAPVFHFYDRAPFPYISEPRKSASMRIRVEKESPKDSGEQYPSKSKRLLKALLSRRKSKKDDMLYTYLDEY
ncbi:UNVERIFIED_CONTAM: protein ABIL2 [Sesamum radiatum]|uniref:Protein ABIL2 n=1 Tax=Sesamum radiatum TaxID=300843 RepID=A0AAW2KDD0_SESRA